MGMIVCFARQSDDAEQGVSEWVHVLTLELELESPLHGPSIHILFMQYAKRRSAGERGSFINN